MVTKSVEVVPVISSPTTPTHQHSVRFYSTKTFRILSMITLTFSFFIIELVVGNITNSLTLVADAFHMLSDLIALAIGLFVVRIAKRRSDINTYGWIRAEVVGANINTVFLLALCLTIIFDTIKRYIEPEPIKKPTLLLIVGSIGLGINIIGLFLFQGYHGHSHGDGAYGHSHDVIDKSTSAYKLKKSIKTKADTNKPDKNNIIARTFSNDMEPIEVIIGHSEFKRHSSRALDEV
jgi:zinc transporter 1